MSGTNGKSNGAHGRTSQGKYAGAPVQADFPQPDRGLGPERGDADKPKPVMGRPTKCTPENTEAIARLIRAGNYLETASHATGVSAIVARQWLKKGHGDREKGLKTREAAFHQAIEAAHGTAEGGLVVAIRAQAQKDWRAAAFILGRKFPKRWGSTVEVADGDGPTSDDTARSLAQLARVLGRREDF